MNELAKKYAVPVVVCVVVMIVGVIVGRTTFTPQTIEKKVTEIQTKVEYKTDETVVQAAIEKWKSENKSWWKEVQYVKVPCPKCSEVKECSENVQIVYVEKSGGTEAQNEGTKDSNSTTVTKEEVKTDTKSKERIDYEQAQWMATVHLGIEPNSITDFTGPFVYGGQLQRRVWKPLWAGAWVHGGSHWSGGLSLSMEW